jgi:hypothetical protein
MPKGRGFYSYLRVIRSIPNYNILIDQKDIIVLEWKSIKSNNDIRTQKLRFALKPYFIANSYKRITFLNRTAQMELAHHLEDQLNQEIAYRHSRQGAEQAEQNIHGFAHLGDESHFCAWRVIECFYQHLFLIAFIYRLIRKVSFQLIVSKYANFILPCLISSIHNTSCHLTNPIFISMTHQSVLRKTSTIC